MQYTSEGYGKSTDGSQHTHYTHDSANNIKLKQKQSSLMQKKSCELKIKHR